MILENLNKIIKPKQKTVSGKPSITEDALMVSNGFVLLKRAYYYVPQLEKLITLNQGAQIGTTLDEDIFNDKGEVENLEHKLYILAFSSQVYVRGENSKSYFDARQVSAMYQYLLDEFKKESKITLKAIPEKYILKVFVDGQFAGSLTGVRVNEENW